MFVCKVRGLLGAPAQVKVFEVKVFQSKLSACLYVKRLLCVYMFVCQSVESLEPKLVLEEKFLRVRHFEVKVTLTPKKV